MENEKEFIELVKRVSDDDLSQARDIIEDELQRRNWDSNCIKLKHHGEVIKEFYSWQALVNYLVDNDQFLEVDPR